MCLQASSIELSNSHSLLVLVLMCVYKDWAIDLDIMCVYWPLSYVAAVPQTSLNLVNRRLIGIAHHLGLISNFLKLSNLSLHSHSPNCRQPLYMHYLLPMLSN